MPEGGISDEKFLKQLSGIYTEAVLAGAVGELAEARKAGLEARVADIHARYTYRMHSLSEFMKALLIRFTRSFNRTHQRSGSLWEECFKCVIAARTMAAYINLNLVRAGMVMVERWSAARRRMEKKERAGLVRACMSHHGTGLDPEKWKEVSRICRRAMGLAPGRKSGRVEVESRGVVTKNTAEVLESKDNETVLPDLRLGIG